ncbi:F21O3.2 PROTEIN [Salix koriyanagi]|uniref:F21O3.2 PROTEIN n=1 Tax=Salix koriyanagi TaxID=2511006 RepID=A0A9Q0TG13_9ROSI|nr:F21O3.2 PROTEIN [Salix koriyanagi]
MAVERSSCLIVLHMDVLITIVINALNYLIESNGVTQLPNNSVSLLLSARRIAELKEDECRVAVEDVMYMLVLYKFSEIRVPLVPKLSRCIYNGRLEIRPSKDWELESIHSFEVLEMVREHVSTVIGLKANSSVADSWATTEVQKCRIGRVYAASILYGYFLKSASLRHHLDWCLALPHQDIHLGHRTTLQYPESQPSYGMKNLVFGHMSNKQSESQGTRLDRPKSELEKLKCYMMGFDSDTLHRCAKLKSEEAVNLIEKHSCALFGDEKTGVLENDEVILTSFSSLKRLVLEAVAFGCFLWDTEEYVNSFWVDSINRQPGSGPWLPKIPGQVCNDEFIFLAITALSSLVFRLIFSATAYLLVLIIQGCRLPSQAVQGGLQLIADATRACFELVLEFIVEKISSSTAAAFDLLIEGISASAALTGSALEGLVEKTRNSLHGVLENSLSQLAEDFGEMISAIMTALWNNYKDAVRYFTENA